LHVFGHSVHAGTVTHNM